jgi:hypothetical protein
MSCVGRNSMTCGVSKLTFLSVQKLNRVDSWRLRRVWVASDGTAESQFDGEIACVGVLICLCGCRDVSVVHAARAVAGGLVGPKNSIRGKIGGLTCGHVARTDANLVAFLLPAELISADLS